MLDRKVSWVIELSVGCAEGYFGSMFPGLALGNEPTGHSPIALGRRQGVLWLLASLWLALWPEGFNNTCLPDLS